MNNYHQTQKTTDFISLLTLMKENELFICKKRMLQLEKLITVEEPNNELYTYRYNHNKIRYEQLKKTIINLRQLEFLLKKSSSV